MYTTTRYASKQTRALAKKMADEHGERYLSRGKRTIRDLVHLARRIGEGYIFIIGESRKKPSTISTLEISEEGNWKWKEKRPL